ncbi:MAG TPA: DUF4157 domain-containing protein [Kofleriaceae bacterium]
MLQFQRTIGNRAVTRLLVGEVAPMPSLGRGPAEPPPPRRKPAAPPVARPPIQAKLTLGAAGDRHEQEADQVAREVVRRMAALDPPQEMPGSERAGRVAPITPLVQRSASAGPAGQTLGPATEAELEGARRGGQALPGPLRAGMEEAFGQDFAPVRVHTDAAADRLSRAFGARAFTTGHDLFFRGGEYDPASRGGQETIAHELTHVVQQRGAPDGSAPIQRTVSFDGHKWRTSLDTKRAFDSQQDAEAYEARPHDLATLRNQVTSGLPVAPQFTQWHINSAVMRHFAARYPELKERLGERELTYLFHFSQNPAFGRDYRQQDSPLTASDYVRSTGGPLYDAYDQVLKESKPDIPAEPKVLPFYSPKGTRKGGFENSTSAPRVTEEEPVITARSDSYDQEEQDFFSRSGYRPNPTQVVAHMMALGKSAQDVIDKFGSAVDGKKNKQNPLIRDDFMSAAPKYKNVAEFVSRSSLKGLVAAIGNADPKKLPHVAPLGGVMVQALAGLQEVAKDVDKVAETASPLVSYLYGRLDEHMTRAIGHVESHLAFMNDMHLISAELSTLLAIAQPYKEEMDKPTLQYPAAHGLNPSSMFKNNGMQAFASILHGIDKMIEAEASGRKPAVAAQPLSYYEQPIAISSYKGGYDAITLEKRVDGLHLKTASTSSGKENASDKLDLYVGAFHHGISTSAKQYDVSKLADEIESLIKNGAVNTPLVVAIDTTIGSTDDPELKDLIGRFKDRIESGELIIAPFRSLQKFDQGGLDDHSGGAMAVYGGATDAQKAFLEGAKSTASPTDSNFQVMYHLQKHASKGLDEYRKAIASTHRAMLGSRTEEPLIPAQMIAPDSDKEGLLVAPSTDPYAPFLDIHMPSRLLQGGAVGMKKSNITSSIMKVLKALDVPAIMRPSFGFPHLNFAEVSEEKARISMGLEGHEAQVKVADALAAMNLVIKIATAGRKPEQANEILTDRGADLATKIARLRQLGLRLDAYPKDNPKDELIVSHQVGEQFEGNREEIERILNDLVGFLDRAGCVGAAISIATYVKATLAMEISVPTRPPPVKKTAPSTKHNSESAKVATELRKLKDKAVENPELVRRIQELKLQRVWDLDAQRKWAKDQLVVRASQREQVLDAIGLK